MTKNTVLVADYDYDANGNRIDGPGLSTPPTYDDQDRLLQYGAKTYTYAPDGTLASVTVGSDVVTYAYDALGSLRSATASTGSLSEYVVDGRARRIGVKRATAAATPVLQQGLLYGDQVRVAAELNGSGSVVARFMFGTDRVAPDVMIKGGEAYRS